MSAGADRCHADGCALRVCTGAADPCQGARTSLSASPVLPVLQFTSDYVPQLEAFVPLLCENALPRKPLVAAAAVRSSGAGGSPARSSSSKAAAAAAAAWEAEEEWSQVRAGCLRALLEHLRFCARLSYVSYHLHTITFAVLACVDASGHGAPQVRVRAWVLPAGRGSRSEHAESSVAAHACSRAWQAGSLCKHRQPFALARLCRFWVSVPCSLCPAASALIHASRALLLVLASVQGRYTSPRAALQALREQDLGRADTLSRGSISHAVGASPPDVAALLVFEELAHMTRVGVGGGTRMGRGWPAALASLAL